MTTQVDPNRADSHDPTRRMASDNQVVHLSPCPECGEKFWCETERGNIYHVQGNDLRLDNPETKKEL